MAQVKDQIRRHIKQTEIWREKEKDKIKRTTHKNSYWIKGKNSLVNIQLVEN